ncbi:MAG: FAD-dependent oxidoreductase [Proteobacteria bacterium]|nr:FAD-dependent oxidoreductase [Pseudomonadota bacterium]
MARAPEVFREKQKIDIRLKHEVAGIDPGAKKLRVRNLENGKEIEEAYDRLIIATGAKPRELDLPGSNLANVFRLKFLEEAIRLKKFLDTEKPARAVSIGAGFIALEMAEAFRGRGLENTILHNDALPGGKLEPEIAGLVRKELEEHGVKYVPNVVVKEFKEGAQGRVGEVVTAGGNYPADLVLLSVGVVPEVKLAKDAGVALGPTGAIAVNERQETSLPGIYAAGDCCEVRHRVSGRPVFLPLGDVANKQGWVAGENAAGGKVTYPGVLGSAQFKCFDLEIGQTGLLVQEAEKLGFSVYAQLIEDASRTRIYPGSRSILVKLIIDRKSHVLLGAQIAGKDGAALRINTLAVAVYKKMTVEELAELDFAYAPPFSPAIDPILVAARAAEKELAGKKD